jgi:hypothetical protein
MSLSSNREVFFENLSGALDFLPEPHPEQPPYNSPYVCHIRTEEFEFFCLVAIFRAERTGSFFLIPKGMKSVIDFRLF